MTVIDDYLGTLDEPQRRELERVRAIVRGLAPDAEDVISYGMPTLDVGGKHVLHFAAFRNHMSIFPGTIRFTPEAPVPEAVVREIVERRLSEIRGVRPTS